MDKYERKVPDMSGRDVLCAWVLAAVVLLALLVLSIA